MTNCKIKAKVKIQEFYTSPGTTFETFNEDIKINTYSLSEIMPSEISGPTSINLHSNSTTTYSINAIKYPDESSTNTYKWIIPAGWSYSGDISDGNTPFTTNSPIISVIPDNCTGGSISVYGVNDICLENTNSNTKIIQISRPWPNMEINGPENLCTNTAYELTNVPYGATINWLPGTGITRISPQGSNPCYFSYSQSRQSEINATVTTSCGSYANVPTKDVWAGVPAISSITGPLYTPNNQWTTYYAQPNNYLMNADNYTWILNPLNGNSVYDYGWSCDIAFYNSGSYQLIVQAHNTCGWGDYYVTGLEVYETRSLSITPNPSSGEVAISIESVDEKELITLEWELEIYNNSQMLKEKKTKMKGKEYRFNTSGWKDGVYMVRVTYKDEILTGKLVVKR